MEKHRLIDEIVLSPSAAKRLGRTMLRKETGILWCTHSGSGISFTAYGMECLLTLKADRSYADERSAARYAVYADGQIVESGILNKPERSVRFPVSPDGTSVRVVKLSEAMNSALGIASIRITADHKTVRTRNGVLLAPEPVKPHFIEFIGDSITCGYGVDGVCGTDSFRTDNENAGKAYAMLAANMLNADYSLVCFSGHGILSGYTSDGTINRNDLLPPYYSRTGISESVPDGNGNRILDDAWDFSILPDLIVINLGTNDASYTGSDAEKQALFTAKYTAFLKTVREQNPTAQILCTLGIMGQTLCPAVEQAAAQYIAETGDNRIRVMRFAEQLPADGFAVDWHPSAVTHQKAAYALAAYIREWLGW